MTPQEWPPPQSPVFHAQNASRYDRQTLVRDYQSRFECRLVVMFDEIFPYSIALFEELIFDANPEEDLHVMLSSPGGDGETAVRLVRSAQARCRELTVVIPDSAKSAATILALGAHNLLMGPTSDLGPVDPQFQMSGGSLASAKDIIAAVEEATKQVQAAPETYPIHASLLADVTALMVQQARAAVDRTGDQVKEALSSNPDRTPSEVKELQKKLKSL